MARWLHIICFLIYKSSVFAYDIPEISLRLLPHINKCEPSGSFNVISERPFRMAIQVDSQQSYGFLTNITCETVYRADLIAAETNDITHHNNSFSVASFATVKQNMDNWNCNFVLSTNEILRCNLKIHVRQLITMMINRNITELITYEVQDTKVTSVCYTKNDILNIDIIKYLSININITDKNGVNLFSGYDPGSIQFILNMYYFIQSILHVSATLSLMNNGAVTKYAIKFDLIPMEGTPKNLLQLNVGGFLLTPHPKGEKEFYYRYVYKYSQTLYLSCEFSSTFQLNITYNGHLFDLIQDRNMIKSNIVLTSNSKAYVIFQLMYNNRLIEKLHIEFIYVRQRGELLITGLPLHKTRIQMKKYTQYIYTENEILTLTCSKEDESNCSTINWLFEEEIVADNRTAVHTNDTCLVTNTFRLTKEYNGKSISCSKKTDTQQYYNSIDLFIENLNVEKIINQQIKDDSNDGDASLAETQAVKAEVDLPDESLNQNQQKIIIISAIIVVIIIVAVVIYLITVLFKKKKAREAINVPYDNLSANSPIESFPSQWNQEPQRLYVNTEYSEPYTQGIDNDTLYAEPVQAKGASSGQIYAELNLKRKEKDIYVNSKIDEYAFVVPKHERNKRNDEYAEVVPKALRKKEEIYAEIVHDINKYQNVFKGDRYINCDNSEYVEPAYCDINKLK